MAWKIPASATLPIPPTANGEVVGWARAFTGAVADLYRVIAEQLGGVLGLHAASHQHGGADEVATATPAANAIPKAGAGGALAAGWIPDLSGSYPAKVNPSVVNNLVAFSDAVGAQKDSGKAPSSFVQTVGDQEMAGSLRITAAAKDFFGGGIGAELGLIQRVVNMGIAPDTHFVSTSPTPGYAWAPTSGIFYGAPNNATFGYRGDYFGGAANGASQAHFFQRAVTNAAANWQNKLLQTRCSPGGSLIAGVRVDDGSNLSTHPFFELVCDGTANDGTFIVKMRYQNTVGGGITTTASQVRLPVTFLQTLSLNVWYSGGQYYISGYLWGEAKANFGIGLGVGPVSWMPCAGRAGIFLKADAAGTWVSGYWDFLYNEFN